MFAKLKAFFQLRLNEAGALPAIMAGSILIAATAVLLAGFSLTVTRNAEINGVKTNVNYYLNRCESILETQVMKDIPSQFSTSTLPNLQSTISQCTLPNSYNGGPIVTISFVGTPTQYTPTGATAPTSVQVTLRADISKGAFQASDYTESVRYLDYVDRTAYALNSTSYISSFDANGNAVWVTP